jgi:sugar transferase (PEP-CTERM/EpsH1 system associated)
MKILMLSPVFPWPPDMGSKMRIFNILKGISRHHDVTFISQSDGREEDGDFREVEKSCSRLYVVPGYQSRGAAVFRSFFSRQPYRVVKFHNMKFQQQINCLLEPGEFDLIWGNRLNTMSFLDPSRVAGIPVVIDLQNADERVWGDFTKKGNWTARLFAAQNLRKLRRFEERVIPRVDQMISVSGDDAAFLRARFPGSRPIWIMPNGVDTDYFRPSPGEECETKDVILFCGSLDIAMNIDAVVRFVDDVLPAIRREIPAAEFWIVGRKPGPRVRNLSRRQGISVWPDVPDVRPYYHAAKVAVAPFRFGGGTKLKVLEAMAMGVPVVSTATGCQGIPVNNGNSVVIANEPPEMSRRILVLFGDRKERKKIGGEARRFVEERYSWNRVLEGIGAKLERLVSDKKSSESRQN